MSNFRELLEVHQSQINDLLASKINEPIERAISDISTALEGGLPVLVMGNGGSASDAMHIAGELVGKFLHERGALNVICLNANPSVLTAWANDYEFETVFSRQVDAHGKGGGVCWGLSTSGNSINVINAFKKARQMGMTTIALTGKGGGALSQFSDVLIEAPTIETPRVQEIHILIYHYICERIEQKFLLNEV
jgi:D-sedoheptulose 7-phosphate isomerase